MSDICCIDPADFCSLDAALEGQASEDILPVNVDTKNLLFIGLAAAALILAVSIAVQFTTFIDKTE